MFFPDTVCSSIRKRNQISLSSSPPGPFPEASKILRRQHFLLNKLSGLCQACLCQALKLQFQQTTGPGAHLCKVCAHESVFVARHHIEHESQVASWKYNNRVFLPLFMLSNPKLDEVPREFITLCFHSPSLCNLTSPQLLPRLPWLCTHSCTRMPTHTYQIEIILSSSMLLITSTQRGSRQSLGGGCRTEARLPAMLLLESHTLETDIAISAARCCIPTVSDGLLGSLGVWWRATHCSGF